MSDQKKFDYIIAGGGLAGSVLARRLADKYPSSSVLVIEAGGRPEGHPLIGPPMACFATHFSELDWAYFSVPQKHWVESQLSSGGDGGSAVNYGLWTRGPACEYDQWAELAGDDSWSWNGLLPYFIKGETFIPGSEPHNPRLHGTSGPITAVGVTASHPDRKYPLREGFAALLGKAGYQPNPDGNSGSVVGFSERCESWKDGRRQPASVAYGIADCKNVTILTTTLVHKVLFEGTTAIGVETSAGVFHASKEVIVSGGSYRSPQILMLSGVGPASTLNKHGIPVVLDAPDVGSHLHDHLALPLYWKLKKQGTAMGDATLGGPAYKVGLPGDWLAFSHDPAVPEAAKAEGADAQTVKHLSHPERCHTELFTSYAAAGPGARKYKTDGATATSMILSMTPTSRGTVSIASTDPTAKPVIDPNYYATETDRIAIRNTVRKTLESTLDTDEGRRIVEEELTEHKGTSDAAIDARVFEWGATFYHPAGTCSMGKVVDGQCRVKGLNNLRVVDASIIPLPLGAHYQATVYALAEKAADAF
ncbi:hypothetical protein BD779DRAFT_1611207 [Infundibulicybe gibba]|nr:hypothetical protein BD779DRAFT_1611207 [Infundibulicybe gibba]